MLAGLPDKFEPIIVAIEHSGISISAEAIKTKLLDMSIEVKSEGAFIAKKHFQSYKFIFIYLYIWAGAPKYQL